MSQQRVMKLATRGKRFAAGMIDCVPAAILIVLLLGVLLKIAVALIQSLLISMNSSDFSVYDGSPYVRNSGLNITPFVIVLMLYSLLQLYFMSRSQSIGKAICHMRVVDAHTGRPIGFAKMLLREVIVKKASRILFLGYIWILIDKYNRSWHDKILDTYVIDEGPKTSHLAHTGEQAGDINTSSGEVSAVDDWKARSEAEQSAREEIMKNLYSGPSDVPFESEEEASETSDESPVIILPGQVVQGPFPEDSDDSAADSVSEKNNEE